MAGLASPPVHATAQRWALPPAWLAAGWPAGGPSTPSRLLSAAETGAQPVAGETVRGRRWRREAEDAALLAGLFSPTVSPTLLGLHGILRATAQKGRPEQAPSPAEAESVRVIPARWRGLARDTPAPGSLPEAAWD